MRGLVVSEMGHVVLALAPVSASGGKTTQAFSMDNYMHASIVIGIGAQAAQMTSIVVNACTSAAGANPTAIPFSVYKAETANGDVLGARTLEAAAGFQPSATAGIFYVIELDAEELPQGSPYVEVVITNGANADFVSVVAFLSGARFAEQQSPTVIV